MMDDFKALVYDYYSHYGRTELPWRIPESEDNYDPYKILVSEIMLQQTQVSRAIPKFHEFMTIFPNLEVLAAADLGTVLRTWSGLGYNRRAKFLHQAAQTIVDQFAGRVPETLSELIGLPGIGVNTAGALLAYAFNRPVVFIETNIRTVYIHHFFQDEQAISDASILKIVAETVDQDEPREWYWALMDYGSHLKKAVGNLSSLSHTYAKQSRFQGSRRQLRGQVLRLLAEQPLAEATLIETLADKRAKSVIAALDQEGLIHKRGNSYEI